MTVDEKIDARRFDEIDAAVEDEEVRQIELWGVQSHLDGTGEQFEAAADLAKASCEAAFNEGTGTYLDILVEEVFEAAAEPDPDKLYIELTQVAAVAKNWMRAIRRRQEAARQVAA